MSTKELELKLSMMKLKIKFMDSTDLDAVEETRLISDIPSSDLEFNDGIGLMSTKELEIKLSMIKLKIEFMDSTDYEPKDMELTEGVNSNN